MMSVYRRSACDVVKRRSKDWRMNRASFANPSIASPKSQLILQPFHCFTYITAHSPTLLLLHLCHSSFSNPSVALPTSQDFHLCHLVSRPWHGGLQLSKITKKNNHVPYNMKCWKCCPLSSTCFWQLFRKCPFTRVDSISELQSIPSLVLAFNSSNVWGLIKNKVYARNHHMLEKLKASTRLEIDCISLSAIGIASRHAAATLKQKALHINIYIS